MSFRRVKSVRTKSLLENNGYESTAILPRTSSIILYRQNACLPKEYLCDKINVKWERDDEVIISSDKIEFVTASSASKTVDLVNASVHVIEVKPIVDESSRDDQTTRSESDQRPSIPIPDSLAMDPLAPTTLAVSTDLMDRIGSGLTLLRDHGKKVQKYIWKNRKFDVLKKSWKSQVNIVLVDAKDLPADEVLSSTNGLYCKFSNPPNPSWVEFRKNPFLADLSAKGIFLPNFKSLRLMVQRYSDVSIYRLGNESTKSKQVSKKEPVWRERFNLYMYEDSNLEVKVWHKGKQKTFVGRCVIDLSQLERERTHELWQELEYGHGSIHLLITLSGSEIVPEPVDNVPTTNGIQQMVTTDDKYTWYRLRDNWGEVGQLSVTVHGARGLSSLGLNGNIDAYCVLEVDNSRVQTHSVHGSSEPNWNKHFIFNINDVTSTLDITIYDESIIQSKKGETLGKISIPLLRINNNVKKWYALKDRSKKNSAKGNCPRILLEMSLDWNPIKASLRVLSPKEIKYVQKPPKFSIPLIYNNLKFIKVVFDYIYLGNEHYKNTFEWENREKSAIALGIWLIFWYFFRMWMTPLLLVVPFIPYWAMYRGNNCSPSQPALTEEETPEDDVELQKDDKTIMTRLNELQDLTFTIKNGIDYIVSVLERIKNLLNFSVPYLSYLAIIALTAAAVAFYVVPINYLFMALGIYKFTRKALNPDRVPNNDILDFISRVPDNEILKQWRELKVTDSSVIRANSMKRR